MERKVIRGVDPSEDEGYYHEGWKLIMITKLNTDGTIHNGDGPACSIEKVLRGKLIIVI